MYSSNHRMVGIYRSYTWVSRCASIYGLTYTPTLFLICSKYIHASKIHSYLFVFYILQLKEEVRPYLHLILENTNLLVIFFCMCSMFCRTLNSV